MDLGFRGGWGYPRESVYLLL